MTGKCSARVNLDRFGYISAAYTDHNHRPPTLKKLANGKYLRFSALLQTVQATESRKIPNYEVMNLPGNRRLIMYKNYTFSYKNTQWSKKRYLYCSKKYSMKCTARFRLNEKGVIFAAFTDHNHQPPHFQKCPNGTYVKIS
ncbi:unnamed protein product, partial [Brenthis ino]